MDWLATQPERRMDPRVLWPGVRSIIMLGVNYGPDENPLALLAKRTRGAISAYAQGDDYHDVIKKRLKALARWLVATSGEEVKVFVDTAAVMEKPLAQAAGLGWQGKHTNLVSREFGSWLFLGAIFTAADLPRDEADSDHCGSCNACQEICPTAAFPAPYKLDARRCISYLTIENKGPIPHEFRKSIGNRIYGCDDCLAVCPWNKFAQEGREAKLSARAELRAPSACGSRAARRCRVPRAVYQIAGQAHRPRPLHPQRADRDRQRRTMPSLAQEAERLLDDASPLVRGAAVWALSQLLTPDAFTALAMASRRRRDRRGRSRGMDGLRRTPLISSHGFRHVPRP